MAQNRFRVREFEREHVSVERVFIGLGSNVGAREDFLARAMIEFDKLGSVVARSSVYESAAVGPRQRAFLNCVVELRTTLMPNKLLAALKLIEQQLGRRDRGRWSPREIDLDILLFGERVVWQSDLHIPHVELAHRRFVLVPLVELAPDFLHPTLRLSFVTLLDYAPLQAIQKWKNSFENYSSKSVKIRRVKDSKRRRVASLKRGKH